MNVITKTELTEQVAEQVGISKAEAGRVLDAITGAITTALVKGDKVALTGFGSFDVSDRKARKGRNPQTGAEIDIPASKSPRFKAGKQLKDAVN